MGLKSTIRRFFDLEETVDPIDDERSSYHGAVEDVPPRQETQTLEKSGKLVAFQNIRQQEKMILVEPKSFDEVEDIVGHLKSRRTVICSLQSVTKTDGQRILDFMSGTAFALDGQIRKIGKDTFLFAPESVDISGMISGWKIDKLNG
ncbi:cell division protein SepF [Sporolactobacillus pectinivorans]|uniref:cell division protein SepF n=1 Tax=Sporolactobacillus pectinivorans TaxID=1591408 RepID=UPI000C25C340|nr:cell division protein SepF [Sporolactobacillus pectinivorans]